MIELVMRRLLLACLSLARKYALIVMLMRGGKKYPETESRRVFISNFLALKKLGLLAITKPLYHTYTALLFFFSFFFPFLFSLFSPSVTCFSRS